MRGDSLQAVSATDLADRGSVRRASRATAPARSLGQWSHLIGPASILIAGVVMLALTWGVYPEPLIDTGRELYVPWRLASGEVLYRDIAYFNGPLSPYVNALWFRLFGVHASTIIWANVGVIALVATLVYRIVLDWSDRFTAAVAGVVFVTVFAFNFLRPFGIFSFVLPYSHEMTHGVLLSLAAVYAFTLFLRRGRWIWLALAGFLLGMVFLTKAEIFLAAAGAVGLGLVLPLALGPKPARAARCLVVFGGSAAIPFLIAAALFCLAMPFDQAVRAAGGSIRYLLTPGIASMPFYRALMGTEDVPANLWRLALSTVAYLIAFVPLAGVAVLAGRRGWGRQVVFPAVLVVAAIVLGLLLDRVPWTSSLIAAPVILLVLLIGSVAAAVRCRNHSGEQGRLLAKATLAAFSLLLLAKILLNVRPYHYGFALAMPAALVLIAFLLHDVPQAICRRGGMGGLFKVASALLILFVCSLYLLVMRGFIQQRVYPVATPTAEFFVNREGSIIGPALDQIRDTIPAGRTLAVVPEGVMLNFLTQHTNPTGYINFMPVEMKMFGEMECLAAFRSHPPDFIIITHKDSSMYGARFFGRDYGLRLSSWIAQNYHKVGLIGHEPNQTPGATGMLFLQHN